MATLFFSYSHKDEDLRDQLEVHLSMLKREGLIEAWHDRKIPAGDEFDHVIDDKLEIADVILLLVSADFLASPYCFDIEVKRAMERHENRSARVIPVILRPCDWHNAPFGKLVAAPKDGKPVTRWTDRDEAFVDVVQQIRSALPSPPTRQPRPQPQSSTGPRSGAGSTGPRSSNLRVKKEFGDSDRDAFMDEGFEHMARFFENSLEELRNRNPGVEGRFKRIDARSFTAVVYRHGKEVSRCAIHHGESRGFGQGITYSTDTRGMGNSFNEQLSIDADEQSLFLKPGGMRMWATGRQNQPQHLTFDGAAEYYWEMLMEPLQR
jgi:hypothetical protein